MAGPQSLKTELVTLNKMEDLRTAATDERYLRRLQAKLLLKAFKELTAVAENFSKGVHGPREKVHDGYQVQNGFLQGGVRGVSHPSLIYSRNRVDIHEAGIAIG